MAGVLCLAVANSEARDILEAAVRAAGESGPAYSARLDIAELHQASPGLLIVDVDELQTDPLEMLRQLRFVLPACVIAVYTSVNEPRWCRDCHLAGATAVLSSASTAPELAYGLRSAIRRGCFTDPHLAAYVV